MGWIEENRITEEELQEIMQNIERMEQAGEFNNLFKGSCMDVGEHPTKEKLLQSISPDMKLFRSTFTKIYGYELTWPGSAEVALTKLESVGCVKAREHYERIVGEYLEEQEKELKNAAEWYKKQIDDEFERREMKLRKQQEVEQMKQDLHQKSDKELLILLQSMNLESIAW